MKKYAFVVGFAFMVLFFANGAQAQTCNESAPSVPCGPVNGQVFSNVMPAVSGTNYCSSGYTLVNRAQVPNTNQWTWGCRISRFFPSTTNCSATVVRAQSRWLTNPITAPNSSIFEIDATVNVTSASGALVSTSLAGKSCVFIGGPTAINVGMFKNRFRFRCTYNRAIPGNRDTLSFRANSGGVVHQVSSSITVNPPPAATLSLSVSPANIITGDSSTLTWTTSNATSCWDYNLGAWASNTGDSRTVSPTTTTTYTMQCWNSAGVSTGVRTSTLTVTCPVTYSNHLCVKTPVDCDASCGTTVNQSATCTAINNCTGGTESLDPTTQCGATCASGPVVCAPCPIPLTPGKHKEVSP